MDLPTAQFDGTTLGSLAGCSAIVWVIVNGVRRFAPRLYGKWVILAASLIVALAAHLLTEQPWSFSNVVILIGNTFLLALIALGAQESAVQATGGGAPATNATERETEAYSGSQSPRFFSSWLR